MDKKKYVLGVDGGGTQTTAILVDLEGAVVVEEKSVSSNIQVVGVEKATKTIIKLIFTCCKKAGCDINSIKSIVLGLAGAGRVSDKKVLLEGLKKSQIKLPAVTVETDARIALEAAFASSFGIVLIAGTGSIAVGKDETGKFFRIGGWGRILGDEGSGYLIALKALNASIRAYEGRGDKTTLVNHALEQFECKTLDDIISKVYSGSTDIAAFASKVIKAAAEFDHVAHNILFNQANELADLVRTLISQMHPKRKMPVALMGGLLETENAYSKMVKERISRSLPQIIIQKPKFPAAFGAAIIGLKAFEF